jgi:hypothetical protein
MDDVDRQGSDERDHENPDCDGHDMTFRLVERRGCGSDLDTASIASKRSMSRCIHPSG